MTILHSDIKKIYDGMADKLSLNVQQLVLIISGLVMAFFHSWKLALVSLAVTPLTIIFSSVFFGVSRFSVDFVFERLEEPLVFTVIAAFCFIYSKRIG